MHEAREAYIAKLVQMPVKRQVEELKDFCLAMIDRTKQSVSEEVYVNLHGSLTNSLQEIYDSLCQIGIEV